jgi:hypothetical protein
MSPFNTRKSRRIPENHFYNGRNVHPPRPQIDTSAKYRHPDLEKLLKEHERLGYKWRYTYFGETETRKAFALIDITDVILRKDRGSSVITLVLLQIVENRSFGFRTRIPTSYLEDEKIMGYLYFMQMVPTKNKCESTIFEREV